jgi:hypothetical protein
MERLCCVPVRMVANLTLGSGLQNKIPIKQKSLVLTPHGASAASSVPRLAEVRQD